MEISPPPMTLERMGSTCSPRPRRGFRVVVLSALCAVFVVALVVGAASERWIAWVAETAHIQKLTSGTEEEEKEAVELLARMRSVRAVPALIRKLSKEVQLGPDMSVLVFEDHIARALVRIGPRAVTGLLSALDETSGEQRATVIWVLGEIGGGARSAVPALSAIAGDGKAEEGSREMAVAALRKINER